MRPSKRRRIRKQKEMAKITAGVLGGAILSTAGAVALIGNHKKKLYEDSLTDVKASDELL